MPSINQQLNQLSADRDGRTLLPLFVALLAQHSALIAAHNALLAKLDNDEGTDDDYVSSLALGDPELTE